ncbi:hypothetical protein M427DRAFT_141844 [Gonapodya prolifera JEL478]|uniref:Protein DPCD n=1 Tax=Gonapodya prolifera (strain JEL478) TaxID=1344416 RepID=A0A139B0M5_GONPJ|nr:hypothetical protein M427DRAFT_141844 [Gonapodya prolifera JEL478]|eukprot:KXS22353.1 hypothetical protein M427DRAFT_141844 [Gonapodya prolifera JEL478]
MLTPRTSNSTIGLSPISAPSRSSALLDPTPSTAPQPRLATDSNPPVSQQRIKEPMRMAAMVEGRHRVHTSFPDGSEIVDEYDVKTEDLVVRRFRPPSVLGRPQPWVHEVGAPPAPPTGLSDSLLTPSSSSPSVVRRDKRHFFQWRCDRCPGPKDNYIVEVDTTGRRVLIKTKNKKFFARLPIPDLDRAGLPFESTVTVQHADKDGGILLVSYRKPPTILDAEERAREERRREARDWAERAKEKEKTGRGGRDDGDCKTQ